MRVFCDSSVLVAGSIKDHPQHEPGKALLDRIASGEDTGFTAAHVLAETFSVLSRIPTVPKLYPADVLALLEKNVFPHFTVVGLPPEDYPEAIRFLVGKGFGGGRIYDMLHLRVAAKLLLDRIYTFNDAEWKAMSPELSALICKPSLVEHS